MGTASRLYIATATPGAGGAAVTAAMTPERCPRQVVPRSVPSERQGPVRSLKMRAVAAPPEPSSSPSGIAKSGCQAASAGLRKDISAVEQAVTEAQQVAEEVEALLPGMRKSGVAEGGYA